MTEHTEQHYGELALALNLGGVVLAIAIGLLARRFGQNADMPAYLIFFCLQIAAIVLGVIARSRPVGKTAAITATLLMVGSLTLVA